MSAESGYGDIVKFDTLPSHYSVIAHIARNEKDFITSNDQESFSESP